MKKVVDLNKLEELVELTHKRVEMAERVLKDPSDENLIEKVRKNMPYYTGMAFEAEINEFEKAGLTSWIKSLISEMEEYL